MKFTFAIHPRTAVCFLMLLVIVGSVAATTEDTGGLTIAEIGERLQVRSLPRVCLKRLCGGGGNFWAIPDLVDAVNRAGMLNCAAIESRKTGQCAGDIQCYEQNFRSFVSGGASCE